ncbi:MAG: hypothetical protein OEZ02_12935 [Anaerolineae bacterium]|nr:hypothetical protein [Anaerolineae bacterium]
MDIFFTDPNDIPLPPEEIRVRSLEARPWPDGRRVEVRMAITPFKERPNLEVQIVNQTGDDVATLSVVETVEAQMDFTMHIREPNPGGSYQVKMQVFYSDLDSLDPETTDKTSAAQILADSKRVVDSAETSFEIRPHDE